MFTNLSFFIDDCLRQENDKSIFVIDKKKSLIDLVIVFMIVISSFTIVGYFFNLLNSIHYLFYMFFISINLSYSLALYLGVKTNIHMKKLHVSIFHAIFMRIMVIINLTSLQGVVFSLLIYQPFLGLIDQIILFLFSISTSIFLILRAKNSSKEHHDIQDNLLKIIILTPTYILIMYVLPTNISAFTIVVPVMIMIIILIIKYYLIPTLRLNKRLQIPLALGTSFVFIVSILYVLKQSFFFENQEDRSLGLFYYHLIEEKVCQLDMESYYSQMIVKDGSYFLKKNKSIQVFNSDCLMVENLDIQYPFTMFQLEGEVSVLSHLDVEDDLDEGYRAYNLYIYKGESFVQERVIYQYGDQPSELFIYNNQLSYALNNDYWIENDRYVPFIKSFENDSKYGYDIRIDTGGIHYQDEQRLIYKSNGLDISSRPKIGGSSVLYSNGYIFRFDLANLNYSNGDTVILRPMIKSVEDVLSNNQEDRIVLSKSDLGIARNIIEGFHYINQHFYIYVNNSMYIFNQKGNLINQIERIPNQYQIMDDQLYILSQSNPGSITKIDINNASEYLPKEHIYSKIEDLDLIHSTTNLHKYSIHEYPIYINYLLLIGFSATLMSNIEYKSMKKSK